MQPRIYISTLLLVVLMPFTAKVKADDRPGKNKNCYNHSVNFGSIGTALSIDRGNSFFAIAGKAGGTFAVKRAKLSLDWASVKA
jgi:hypothetical protein